MCLHRLMEVLRAQLKERLSKVEQEPPPLCFCAATFWDSHPDTCANNCIFHNNHRGDCCTHCALAHLVTQMHYKAQGKRPVITDSNWHQCLPQRTPRRCSPPWLVWICRWRSRYWFGFIGFESLHKCLKTFWNCHFTFLTRIKVFNILLVSFWSLLCFLMLNQKKKPKKKIKASWKPSPQQRVCHDLTIKIHFYFL